MAGSTGVHPHTASRVSARRNGPTGANREGEPTIGRSRAGRDVRRRGRRDRHECHGESTDHDGRCEGPYPGHERSGYGEASAARQVP